MKKGLFLLSTLILLSISFLSCQKDCSIESKDTGLTVTPENIGYIHNECLEAAYEAIKDSPIFDQSSGSSHVVTIQDVVNVIGKADVACFKKLGEMKKLSDSDLRNFVNQNLSTQIPEGVYRAMSNMIYDSNFSYTRDYLTPEYGNNISNVQKEFVEDFIITAAAHPATQPVNNAGLLCCPISRLPTVTAAITSIPATNPLAAERFMYCSTISSEGRKKYSKSTAKAKKLKNSRCGVSTPTSPNSDKNPRHPYHFVLLILVPPFVNVVYFYLYVINIPHFFLPVKPSVPKRIAIVPRWVYNKSVIPILTERKS